MKKSLPIAFALLVGFVGFLALHIPNEPLAAQPTRQIRVAVYEHRMGSLETACSTQHLREHLFARMIDKNLRDLGHSLFLVNATSSLDKIIIKIEFWADNENPTRLAEQIALAISLPPDDLLVEQEQTIVEYEEGLLAATDDMASIASETVLGRASLPTFDRACLLEESQRAINRKEGGAKIDFDIFERTSSNDYVKLHEERHKAGRHSNVWDTITRKLEKEETNQPLGALFFAYRGPATAVLTVTAATEVLKLIGKSQAQTLELRPFGKTGFLLLGSPSELAAIKSVVDQNQIFLAAHPSPTITESLGFKYVCKPSVDEGKGSTQLANERISHPYFEFWVRDGLCNKKSATAKAYAAPARLDHVAIPKEGSGEGSIEPTPAFKAKLCLSESHSKKESLAIASLALRQHFRQDLGLILTMQFKKLDGNCVLANVYSPPQFMDRAIEVIADFDFSDPIFQDRMIGIASQYYCSRSLDKKCESLRVGKKPDMNIGKEVIILDVHF